MKIIVFWFKFHRLLHLRIKLTIGRYRFNPLVSLLLTGSPSHGNYPSWQSTFGIGHTCTSAPSKGNYSCQYLLRFVTKCILTCTSPVLSNNLLKLYLLWIGNLDEVQAFYPNMSARTHFSQTRKIWPVLVKCTGDYKILFDVSVNVVVQCIHFTQSGYWSYHGSQNRHTTQFNTWWV